MINKQKPAPKKPVKRDVCKPKKGKKDRFSRNKVNIKKLFKSLTPAFFPQKIFFDTFLPPHVVILFYYILLVENFVHFNFHLFQFLALKPY